MRTNHRAALLIAGLAAIATTLACGGFYTDDPTATPGPSPTPLPEGYVAPEDIEEVIVDNARMAIADRLGEQVLAVAVDEVTGVAWTPANPGCLPPPDFGGNYVIPGLVASVFYKSIRYEYHADKFGGNGVLCDAVAQSLPFSDLDELGNVITPERFVDTVLVARTPGQANELLRLYEGAITLSTDDIDWATETLVGSTLVASGCSVSADLDSVEVDFDSNVVTLRVAGEAEGACEQELLVPIFVLVEGGPADASYQFETDFDAANVSPVPSRPVPIGATPTPDPLLETLQTVVAN